MAVDKRRQIVDLDRIGHRQDRPGAGAQPDRLIVEPPIHHIAVAGFLQKVGGHPALGETGAEPAFRLLPGQAGDHLGGLGDQPRLVLLPEGVLPLGIGAAMADEFVAAAADALDNVGAVFEHRRVDVVRAGQPEFVEQIEVVPDPDPVAVIAPGVVALVLRARAAGRIGAEPSAERKMLDVVAEEDREPLAFRPVINRPFGDRHVIVAAVRREFHSRDLASAGSPSPQRAQRGG